MDHRSVGHDAVAPRRAVGEYQRKGGVRNAAGSAHTKGVQRRDLFGLAWSRNSSSPRRRASPGPPTGQALVVAEATLRSSPEPLLDNT